MLTTVAGPSSVYVAMLFRLGAVLLIATLIHRHGHRVREQGARPILLSEVREFLPDAHRLRLATRANGGFRVVDPEGRLIGFARRTMPHSRDIKGYSGPTDVLLVFDAKEVLLGIAVRHSYDTPSHVEDVEKDYLFMEQWNGKSRREILAMRDWPSSRFHIVSGASRTSEAVVESVVLRSAVGEKGASVGPTWRFRWHDLALIVLAAAGILLAFGKWGWLQRSKWAIHAVMVVYLGLISGDLLAQSLLVSWVEHGVPWHSLIGLVILAGVAFLVPWSTGKPVYCTHICPHGHVQRWLMKVVPARRKFHLGKQEKWSFSALPGLLLATVLLVVFWRLPIDLAGFEPFDAWSIKGVGVATVTVAVVGLIFSLFVPMGYCRYGCPTGFLLELVKRRRRGGFRPRDAWLGGLCLLTLLLYFTYPLFQRIL